MQTRVLHLSGHEIFLHEVLIHSSEKYIFDYILRKNDVDFRFKNDPLYQQSRFFYVTPFDKNIVLWVYECIKIIYSSNYKIVHLHIGILSGLLLPFLFFSKSKFIVHNHTKPSYNKGFVKKFLFKVLQFFIKKIATVKVSCSKKTGDLLFNNDYKIVYSPVNEKKFKFSILDREIFRKELSLKATDYMCIMVSHYCSVKNHIFILEIFKKIHNYKDFKLYCFGDDLGSLSKLKNYVNEHKLGDSVFLCGGNLNINKYLSSADLFLMPSLSEGWGIAAVEAQLNGLPCLLSEEMDKDISISNNVKFLPINDQDIWIDQILIKNKRVCSDLTENRFNSSEMCDNLLNIYESL